MQQELISSGGALTVTKPAAAATHPALHRTRGPAPHHSPRPGGTQTPLPPLGPRRVQTPAFLSRLGHRLRSHRTAEPALVCRPPAPPCHPGAEMASAAPRRGAQPASLLQLQGLALSLWTERPSFEDGSQIATCCLWELSDTGFGPQAGHLPNGWLWTRHVFIFLSASFPLCKMGTAGWQAAQTSRTCVSLRPSLRCR